MAKSARVNVRIDPKAKKQAEALYSKFGLTLSDAVTVFINMSLLVNGLPFDLKFDTPNATTTAAMAEAESIESRGARYGTAEEMIKALEAEDNES